MRAYRDERDERNFVLRHHCKTWGAAFAGANHALRRPPEGYRLLKATLARSPNRGGRDCDLTIIFRHRDRRVPRIVDLDRARRAGAGIARAIEEEQSVDNSAQEGQNLACGVGE